MAKNLNVNKKGKSSKTPRHNNNSNSGVLKLPQTKDVVFVSVNSNTLIDYKKVLCGWKEKGSDERNFFLKMIFKDNNSILDGKTRRNGRFVVLVLPQVSVEISSYFGPHEIMDEILKNTVQVEIDKKYEAKFNQLTKWLAKSYNKAGLFLDSDGKPTADGIIMAQSSLLNVTLITSDKHFDDIAKIKEINEHFFNQLSNDHNRENRAFFQMFLSHSNRENLIPRSPKNMIKSLSKPKTNGKPPFVAPKINQSLLSLETNEKIEEIMQVHSNQNKNPKYRSQNRQNKPSKRLESPKTEFSFT